MKITAIQLRRIIKQEVKRLEENYDPMTGAPEAGTSPVKQGKHPVKLLRMEDMLAKIEELIANEQDPEQIKKLEMVHSTIEQNMSQG